MLEELKEELKPAHPSEDGRLQRLLERGKKRLEGLTGTKINFEEEGLAKDLLFDYCRYAYNNALEYFEENFQKEIVRLQYQEAIRVSKEVVINEG